MQYLEKLNADGERLTYDVYSGELVPVEQFWKEFQPWLLSHGYRLRPRYDPNWKPSWIGTNKDPLDCEDYRRMHTATLLDATRISDNTQVILKSIWIDDGPQEVSILNYLSQKELVSMPDNHCVSVIEVLEVPNHENHHVVVMPLLRPFNDPPMRTIGEAVDFFRQIFSGLKFLHDRNIVHRDCCDQNIMMESTKLYPEGFDFLEIDKKQGGHGKPRHYSRTERPPRYCFIDYGISSRYTDDGPHLEYPIKGGDKTAPEHAILVDGFRVRCDPFPTDIYYLGNLIKKHFLEPNINFGFMRSLVNDMTQEDPAKRPKIDEVVKRFNDIMVRLSWFRLRSRIVPRSDIRFPPVYLIKEFIHAFRTVRYILRSLPALPPSPAPRISYDLPKSE